MISQTPLSRSPEQPVVRSRHLQFRRTGFEPRIAYHSLFGNLSWMDAELHEALESTPGPTRYGDLATRFGTEIAHQLVDSYFYVSSPGEERSEIAAWLDERRARAGEGTYLGGLQITSSNACNFACAYCFADSSDRRSPARQSIADGPANIPYELAERAIRKVQAVAGRHGRDRIAVKFLGREPLVNWGVIQRLLEAFDDGSVVWALTTNGSLIRPEIAEHLARYGVMTMVSLDGPPQVNDRLRVHKVAEGPTYASVEKALEILAAAGHPFGVSSVLSRVADFAVMKPFCDRLVELGARELELTLVMQTGDLRAQAVHEDDRAFAERLVDLYRHAAGRGLLVHGDWVDPFHRILSTHKFRDEDEVVRPLGATCSATSHQISVEPSGDLFPCRAMSTHYGHIDHLDAVLQGNEYRKVALRTYYNVPACHTCELEGFCQGTCLGSSEEASGDIYQPQPEYCEVYRHATRLLFDTLSPPAHAVEVGP